LLFPGAAFDIDVAAPSAPAFFGATATPLAGAGGVTAGFARTGLAAAAAGRTELPVSDLPLLALICFIPCEKLRPFGSVSKITSVARNEQAFGKPTQERRVSFDTEKTPLRHDRVARATSDGTVPRVVVAGKPNRVKSVAIIEHGRIRICRRGFGKAPFSGGRPPFRRMADGA
jgi:hypothetical protein